MAGHGSVAPSEPPVAPDRATTHTVQSVIENQPMEVASRGRLYLSQHQRRRLGLNGPENGRGANVTAVISVVDRVHDDFVHVNTAAFNATVVTDGVVRIPQDVRDRLGVQDGDNLRVSIQRGD